MITISIAGDASIAARLADFPSRLQQRLATVMAKLGGDLSDRIGQSRSSRFAAALDVVVTEDATSARVAVGLVGSRGPGRARHGGTPRRHLREAKRSFAVPVRSRAAASTQGSLAAVLAGFSDDATAAIETAMLGELEPMNREPIYAALFALVSGVGGIVTASRRLRHWSAVEAAEQPALFQVQKKEAARQAEGAPTVWRAELDLYVYCQAPDDATSPAIVLNPLLDAIEAALAPQGIDRVTGVQTLGGLVQRCWISGAIETDEGALGGQAVAILPIEILATP